MKYMGWNGKVVPRHEVTISPMDHGLMYGMGLFETFRTYDGRPFLLAEHGERLNSACQALGIEYVFDPDETLSWVQALLEANQVDDAVIRYTVTAGEKPGGLPRGNYDEPQILIYLRPLPAFDGSREGKSLQLLQTRRNTPEGDIRFKSLHYMNSILANRELARYPWASAAEGLQLTEQGMVAEGIVSNVFFVRRDGVCCTPALSTGILPGVTRAFVLKMLKEFHLPIEEGEYGWEDLLQAKEIFLTNSVQGLTPVTTLYDLSGNAFVVSEQKPGDVTHFLQQEYQKRAEEVK